MALLVTLAIPAAPALGQTTSAANTAQIVIDVPPAAANVNNGSRVLIGGWAVDPAGPGVGIDQVRVYLDGMMDQGGTLLGSATTGGPRPDVARALNNQAFTDSGFDFFWMPMNVSSGNHTIYVYAHSTTSSSWSYKSVVVNVAGPPTGGDQYMPGPGMGDDRYGRRGMGQRGMMGREGMGQRGMMGQDGMGYDGTSGREGMQYPYDLMERGRSRPCITIYPPFPRGCEPLFIPPPPPPPPLYFPPQIGGMTGSLVVTPAATTGTTVALVYTPVPGAVSYRVLQSLAGGAFVQANAVTLTPATATVTGLLPLTTYIFQVVALDALGNPITSSQPVTVTTTVGP
jgi:hypothetical protein